MLKENNGCGCGGCLMLIGFIFIVYSIIYSIIYGVEIGDKKWNIDLFPPRIWDMNKAQVVKENKPVSKSVLESSKVQKSEQIEKISSKK